MEITKQIGELAYVGNTPREAVVLFGRLMPGGSTVDREKFTYNEVNGLTKSESGIVKGFGSELLKNEVGFRLSWFSEKDGETNVEELIVDNDFEISTEERDPWTKSIVLKEEGINEKGIKEIIIRRFTQKRGI